LFGHLTHKKKKPPSLPTPALHAVDRRLMLPSACV
jgi:hypothetical protein